MDFSIAMPTNEDKQRRHRSPEILCLGEKSRHKVQARD
jgi:hypothetical protein